MKRSFRIPGLLALLAAPLLTGCLSLGQSQSAQTLRPNQVQHVFGLEWFRVDSTVGGGDEEFIMPSAMPFYGLRFGLGDGLDLGFRTNATLSNFSLDLKVQPIDGKYVDVALDPGLQYAWTWGWAQLPLLVGLNFNERVQLTLTGRIAYALPMLDDAVWDELEDTVGTDPQMIGGAGVSLYLRVSRKLAIVPEVQVARGFGEREPLILSFTIGFTLGDQPNVEPQPTPPRPPPPPVPHRPSPDWAPPSAAPPGSPSDLPQDPNGLAPHTPPGYAPQQTPLQGPTQGPTQAPTPSGNGPEASVPNPNMAPDPATPDPATPDPAAGAREVTE